jgi:DNA-binding winged helix-turn-helix (wHTH) protein
LRFLFEDYVLDEARHELWRGGEIVPVEARVFELLTYLIRNRERMVSQEDLRMAVCDGRIVSVSTISSSLNAARTAIGDNGDDQRFIRTVPRKGFRFVAAVVEEPAGGEAAALPVVSDTKERLPVADAGTEPAPTLPGRLVDLTIARPKAVRAAAIFAVGAVAGLVVAAFFFFLSPWHSTPQPRPTKTFDASIVPLVDDDTRRALANYPSRPDHKALAIGGLGQFHVTDGAPSAEHAREAALEGCFATSKRPCRVYASGTGVVWSEHALPLPAPRDVRTQSLGIPLDPDAIPTLTAAGRKTVAAQMRVKGVSRALALSTRRYHGHHASTTGEAIRIALERCSFGSGRPCLILAVNGFQTVEIPKTRRVTRTFLPSTDRELTDAEKDRIARIYQGREWRALARGGTGSWHAIADAPSEEAAIAAALKACAQADSGCRLFAIGNFVVADE